MPVRTGRFRQRLSSFTYLNTLSVDFIKIDGAFVKTIVDDPIHLARVRSINEIGQVMGKQTIAEFVESETILGGCDGWALIALRVTVLADHGRLRRCVPT